MRISILCRSKTIPRTIWMTCTQVIMVITYLLFASALDGTLYAATALLGICYGVQFSIMVPTVSELFGLKHFGIFYNFMSLGNPLGAFLFSGLLAGYVYDNEAAKQQGMNLLNSSVSCLGPNCFRLTFLVLAGVCGVGSILSIILTMRIRPVYQMLYSGGSFRLPQNSDHWVDQNGAWKRWILLENLPSEFVFFWTLVNSVHVWALLKLAHFYIWFVMSAL